MTSDLPIVHADAAIVVVDKPAGLLAVPGRGADKHDCAAVRVQARHADARVVHRLDQATSGLMLFARGPAAARRLGAAFERREVAKRYVALVAGLLVDDTGTIDLPLAADWPDRPRQKVDAVAGKPSSTCFRVVARDRDRTRVELRPLTGRSHQLRVHLAAIGHPILGDALYAAPPIRLLAPRLLLHASGLAFAHPLTEDAVAFESAPPF